MSATEQKNGNRSLTLKEARELTPPVDPVQALRCQLQMALFNGVKEDDVVKMAEKLRDMAMGGDLKAMKMYFELVVGKDRKEAAPPADSAGLRMMAEAMRDLVDEIRIAKAKGGRRALTHDDDE
jgi:hypothetical protein